MYTNIQSHVHSHLYVLARTDNQLNTYLNSFHWKKKIFSGLIFSGMRKDISKMELIHWAVVSLYFLQERNLYKIEEPVVLKSEAILALAKMKMNKAAGKDEIVIQTIQGLINELYDNGELPEDLSRSVFVILPNRSSANKCDFHRTISYINPQYCRIHSKIKP